MKLIKCKCGSTRFTAPMVTITLHDLPCELSVHDGPQYDDSEARYSEGWDTEVDQEVVCSGCFKRYHLESSGDKTIIEPIAQDAQEG